MHSPSQCHPSTYCVQAALPGTDWGPCPRELPVRERESTGWIIPRWLSGKESVCQYGRCKRCGFDPWFRKIPWRRKCNPLLYFCLENAIDRGAWRAIAHEIAKSLTWQSTHTHTHTYRQWRPWMKSKARKRWTSQIGRKAYFVRGCQGSPQWEKVTLGWNPKEKGCDILRFVGGSPLSAERATDAQALGLAPMVWQATFSWCCAWVCVGRWRGGKNTWRMGLSWKALDERNSNEPQPKWPVSEGWKPNAIGSVMKRYWTWLLLLWCLG